MNERTNGRMDVQVFVVAMGGKLPVLGDKATRLAESAPMMQMNAATISTNTTASARANAVRFRRGVSIGKEFTSYKSRSGSTNNYWWNQNNSFTTSLSNIFLKASRMDRMPSKYFFEKSNSRKLAGALRDVIAVFFSKERNIIIICFNNGIARYPSSFWSLQVCFYPSNFIR